MSYSYVKKLIDKKGIIGTSIHVTKNLISLYKILGWKDTVGILKSMMTGETVTEVYVPYLKEKIKIRPKSASIYTMKEVLLEESFDYGSEVDTIVDVGAQIGLKTLYFIRMYHDAKIISIEPDKENYNLLEKNTSNKNNAVTINKPLWSRVESFKKIEGNGRNKHMFLPCKEGRYISTTIEKNMEKYELENIDMLKIDIEGAEKFIFSNPETNRWLSSTNLIEIEVHSNTEKKKVVSYTKKKGM